MSSWDTSRLHVNGGPGGLCCGTDLAKRMVARLIDLHFQPSISHDEPGEAREHGQPCCRRCIEYISSGCRGCSLIDYFSAQHILTQDNDAPSHSRGTQHELSKAPI